MIFNILKFEVAFSRRYEKDYKENQALRKMIFFVNPALCFLPEAGILVRSSHVLTQSKANQ